jgi:formate hydrogenlyase subunit 4
VSGLGIAGGVIQALVITGGAPVLAGLLRQVRARLEGRAGQGVGQPWRDLRKLLRKEPVTPDGTSELFRIAPLVLLGTTAVAAGVAPFVTDASALGPAADLFAVAALLAMGTATLALAAIDTGTAFGGMGASREMTIMALAEPTLLMSVFALSVRAGSTSLPAIAAAALHDPARVLTPASLLAAVALGMVAIAETGRLPIDNPATHLELTMVHEAMILEYAGPDLALIELASAMRLVVFLGLLATLFLPWGSATSAAPLALAVGTAAFAAKVGVLGAVLAAGEVFMAKLRLFRVPELLAGSFVLALLAVAASWLLGAP